MIIRLRLHSIVHHKYDPFYPRNWSLIIGSHLVRAETHHRISALSILFTIDTRGLVNLMGKKRKQKRHMYSTVVLNIEVFHQN